MDDRYIVGRRAPGRPKAARSRCYRLASWGLAAASMTAVVGLVPTGPADAAPLQTVTLEIPNVGATFSPFYLGIQDGIYQKDGINLKIETSITPPLAVDAIQGGSLDMMSAIGTAGSAGVNGQSLRVYDVMADHIDFVMIGAKGITRMSQLAGKTVVGESATSETNLIETLMLEHANVNPSSVSVVNVTGGDAARAALVEAGKAQGVSVEITGALTLEAKGYKVISNSNFVLEPFTGLATSQSFASGHAQLMKEMLAATTAATNVVRTNEAKTTAVLEAAPYSLSASNAKSVWKYVSTEWTTDGRPSTAAVDNQLVAWQKQYKLATKPVASKAFDFSYLPAASS
jgi:ABC-type nitrate/sulfonate/bicarbonate transport system substrate-binding protein